MLDVYQIIALLVTFYDAINEIAFESVFFNLFSVNNQMHQMIKIIPEYS